MLFLTLGWVIAGIGASGLLLALYADRSRGKRRCPKCHYDLQDTQGLTCPECGRSHAHEGRLYLTRRHWRMAAGATLILLAGLATLQVPRVQKHGWPAVTPTWALIRSFEHLDNLGPDWPKELTNRLRTPATSDRARRSLLHTAIRIAGDTTADPADRVRAIQIIADSEDPNGAPFYGSYPNAVPYASRVSAYNDAFDEAYDALLAAALDQDPTVQHAAGVAMGTFYSSFGAPKPGNDLPTRHAYPAMAALLVTPGMGPEGPGPVGSSFFNAVGQRSNGVWRVLYRPDADRPRDPLPEEWAALAHDRAAAVERLSQDATHESWSVAVLATWGLLALDADTPAAADALHRAARHPEEDVRETAVVVYEQLAKRGHLPFDAAFFVDLKDDPGERVSRAAQTALFKAEPMPPEGMRLVIEQLESEDPAYQSAGIKWLKHIEDHLEEWAEQGTTYDPALLQELRDRAEHAAQADGGPKDG